MDTPAHAVDHAEFLLPDGGRVRLRPIRPDDAPRLQAMAPRLSAETIYSRFFSYRRELRAAEAAHLAQVDGRDRVAIVAERVTAQGPELIGVARYERTAATVPPTTDFAIVIEDQFQRTGVGRALLEQLVVAAQRNGITRLEGVVLAANQPMLDFVRSVGLPVTFDQQSTEVHFAWDIAPPTQPTAAR